MLKCLCSLPHNPCLVAARVLHLYACLTCSSVHNATLHPLLAHHHLCSVDVYCVFFIFFRLHFSVFFFFFLFCNVFSATYSQHLTSTCSWISPEQESWPCHVCPRSVTMVTGVVDQIEVFYFRVICTFDQCDSSFCVLQLKALIKPNWCVLLHCCACLYHSLIVVQLSWTRAPCPTTKLGLLISKSFVGIKQKVICVALRTPLKNKIGNVYL